MASTTTKNKWVAKLVETWKVDRNSIPLIEFFESINEAAEMRRLSSKDKLLLDRLKLRGTARAFYSAQPQLKAVDASYEEFRAAFIKRFNDKHTDKFHYATLENASQKMKVPKCFWIVSENCVNGRSVVVRARKNKPSLMKKLIAGFKLRS
jgi:hypothetical protein